MTDNHDLIAAHINDSIVQECIELLKKIANDPDDYDVNELIQDSYILGSLVNDLGSIDDAIGFSCEGNELEDWDATASGALSFCSDLSVGILDGSDVVEIHSAFTPTDQLPDFQPCCPSHAEDARLARQED